MLKHYLDIKMLAEYVKIKPSTPYAWAAQEKIPCLKVHGLIRVERDTTVASHDARNAPRHG